MVPSLRPTSLVLVAVAAVFVGSISARAQAPAKAQASAGGKGAVAGTVTNADGSPGAGAMVVLTGRAAVQGGSTGTAATRLSDTRGPLRFQAKVGRDGTFQELAVPAGHYSVSARGKGGAVANGSVHVSAGETSRVSLRLSNMDSEPRPANPGGASDGSGASSRGRGQVQSRGRAGRAFDANEGGRPIPRNAKPLPRRTPPNTRDTREADAT